MKGLVKIIMGLNLLCRRTTSMKICSLAINNYATSRNYSKFTAPGFTSLLSSYLQTCPYSNNSDYLHRKYQEPTGEYKVIKEGDMINLQDFLFTTNRDYLLKYNDEQVKAADLAGKVIVLYLMPVHCSYSRRMLRRSVSILIDTYTYLLPENNFEVVLVAYGTVEDRILGDSHTISEKYFEDIFSCMPWTAIPFSDITSREHLVSRFGIHWSDPYITSVVIDSSGIVLKRDGSELFERYRGLGYPFTNEWIEYLEDQDAVTARKPSLNALLGSPRRDYVISNKGDKVLIDTLGEKVVGLYFYEEGITPKWVTDNIKKVYEELAQNKSCLEVVLIYLYSTDGTLDRTSEESYCKTFETMPWLAIPFKDPKCERLTRFFGYPNNWDKDREPPTLVIFGPHGEFIEPWGADIMCKFKLPAYPFTREKVAELYTEKIRELKLEMLWERNTTFRRKNKSKVRFSQLVGKRIIIFFEGNEEFDTRREVVVEFLRMLKKRYFDMKGTSDEFEVIYISSGDKKSPYKKHIADVPWVLSFASDLSTIDLSLYCCYCHLLLASAVSTRYCGECGKSSRRESSMLAFDQDGRIFRKSLELIFYCSDFPFCDGSMEEEALHELNGSYFWSDMDERHRGLLINRYDKNENLPYIYSSDIVDLELQIHNRSSGDEL